eukprot:14585333-Alexandrium_andersonii.AAC.1
MARSSAASLASSGLCWRSWPRSSLILCAMGAAASVSPQFSARSWPSSGSESSELRPWEWPRWGRR